MEDDGEHTDDLATVFGDSNQLGTDHKDVLEEASGEGEYEVGQGLVVDDLAQCGEHLEHQVLGPGFFVQLPLLLLLILQLVCQLIEVVHNTLDRIHAVALGGWSLLQKLRQ